MPTSLSFPSDAFPGYPTLSVEAPENWVALGAVGLPLALARDLEGQTFRPNVLVSISRLGADHSFEKQVSVVNARVKKLPRFKELNRETIEADDRWELLVEGRFAGAKGELLKQNVRIVVLKRAYVYDVVEITGTVSLIARDNGEEEMNAIVRSIEVGLPQ